MLFYSKASLRAAWALFALLSALFFGLPLAILAIASLAKQWNGMFASHLGFGNLLDALDGPRGLALLASLATATIATLCSTVLGTWGALAARNMRGWSRMFMDGVYIMPITLPSVTVGLAILVTFSRPPFLLNGTPYLVVMSHVILITAYTYNCIRAGLERLPESYEQVAAILGATRADILWRVTLPMLRPYIAAAASLSFAYSMGELGATIMVYPPGWVTAPVDICALTDRGSIFTGAAMSVLLLLAAVLALVALNRLGRQESRHGATH